MDNQSHSGQNFDEEKDFLDSFDIERFWYVLQRSKFWLIGFILLTTATAYIYVRYTKPVYKSESIIKLDFESEANVLGLVEVVNNQELNEMSGEIELIKSKLFLTRVVEAADIYISYHVYGRYLTDERYKNSPFVVSYKIHNSNFLNKRIDVEINNEKSFTLRYQKGNQEIEEDYFFGQEIKLEDFNFLIEKTENFKDDAVGERFFFVVSSKDALIDYLQKNLEVIPENFNAQTIKISFADFKAQKAKDLVKLIDSLYLDYTKEVKNQAIEQKIRFLDSQITATEEKLSNYEAYFEEFTIENRTTNLSEDLNRTIEQLALLDSQRYDLKGKIYDLELITKQIVAKGPVLINPMTLEYLPKSLSSVLDEYASLQQERELKLASYNETSYVVEQINMKMEKAQETASGLMNVYKESLDERLNQINRRRKMLESKLAQLPSMGTEYGKNRRFYDLQEDFMLSLRTSKIELEITRAGTVTKNVILSPASSPTVPIKPQKILIITAGFMLGLVVSVIFLLIIYLAHNKIAGVRELEKLIRVPLLGAVPNYKRKNLDHTSLVVDKNSTSAISEALRTIRTNMDFISGNNGPQLISVTSTVSGEGKTFISVNMGAIMASAGKSVCVVDIDMRKPKVHLAFNSVNKKEGVSTILARKCTVEASIQASEIEGLSFVSAGPMPPNPSELLLQNEFDDMLKSLSDRFDVVIMDTPPVGLVTDGRLVMKKSDIQLYVFRADYSRRSFTKVVNDLRSTGQFNSLTAILNSIDNTPVYGYGYGYGYGYYEEEKSKIKKLASSFKSFF